MTKDRVEDLSQPQRVVRVFISSTFRDMHGEREELVKFTFPELRKRCRERVVEFVDVDLRWGVTDEQKAEGKVLPICLAEIERCRPYFIGLLGERYGWIPQDIPQELIDQQEWLKEHKHKSVTELEIIHGVLENPEMEKVSFFYFRDPGASAKVEEELSKKSDYLPEPEASRAKLIMLKDRIHGHEKNYPVPVRMDFPDAKKLGQLVLEDLWTVIDERFPKEEVPSALEREQMEHEAFAETRRKVYIGREEYYKKLDEHIEGEGPPLVLLGESGSGKSALIANWAMRYREKNPDDFMVIHFIGGTPDSADYVRILRRIMEEIKERCEPKKEKGIADIPTLVKGGGGGFSEEIPTDPKKVVEAFPLWLAKASAKGRFILVLDALNQLEDRDNALDLVWLPEYFPPNIRVILSTLPGRSLEALERRNLQTLNIGPITIEERKKFVVDYLHQYRKSLSTSNVEKIAAASQSANPLYLRTFLEELRIFGKYEELENRINHYLKAQTVDDLFELVLERLEGDYEGERKGLVKDAMSYLWAARRGLSESELMELLGDSDPDSLSFPHVGNPSEKDAGQADMTEKKLPLPRAVWSPLYLAAEESLVSRSGLLNFFHDFLRKAVEDKYLYQTELKQKAHIRLADFFEKREMDDRKVDELPWQLKEAENWERLKDCITDMDMFLKLQTDIKKYELIGSWLSIGNRFDMVEGYNAMINRYERNSPPEVELSFRLNGVAVFLDLSARYKGAEPLHRRTLAISEKVFGKEHPNTASSLNNIAELLRSKGDYEGAEPLYRRALAIEEKVLGAEHSSTAASLNNLAGLLYSKGDYEGAEPLYRKALAICEKVLGKGHPDTARSLNNLALMYYAQGRYAEAEPLFKQASTIWGKTLGSEHPYVAISFNNIANIYRDQGKYMEALPLYNQALEIANEKLVPNHPNIVLFKKNLKACQDAMRGRDSASTIQEPKGLIGKLKKFFKRK